jgi:acetyltransferase EpsM
MSKQEIVLIGLEWDMVDLIESIQNFKLIGVLEFSSDCNFKHLSYLGQDADWEKIRKSHPNIKVALTVDRYADRVRLSKLYGDAALISIYSSHSYISPYVTLGIGTIVQRGVQIMPQVEIGSFCKININAMVHHESKIGDFCTLAPGSQILGRVVISDRVYIGAGAVIRQNCRIGEEAIIGAGAVVVQDVPPRVTVVGVPAKELNNK